MGNLQWGDIVLYSIPALGLLGILFMAIKSAWVTKQDAGDENMQELAGYIAKGAMAFLKAEWKVLAYFVVIAGALLAWSGTLVETSSPVIAISFIFGAVLSALAGYMYKFDSNIDNWLFSWCDVGNKYLAASYEYFLQKKFNPQFNKLEMAGK